jgi:hypothetical protein
VSAKALEIADPGLSAIANLLREYKICKTIGPSQWSVSDIASAIRAVLDNALKPQQIEKVIERLTR